MAILVDYSGVSLATVFSQRTSDFNPDFIRHLILNSLRMYNIKYRKDYGQMTLAVDSGSWRRDVFEQYKAARRKTREESTVDWNAVFETLNAVRDEIRDTFPYKVIGVHKAEADDVIGTVVQSFQEFGCSEPVMIISADKDFLQLQRYKNVRQWSPLTKKFISDANPHAYLLEHIFRGDTGDGVPNIKSDDDTFVSDKRQVPVSKKDIAAWCEAHRQGTLEKILPQELLRNYHRNRGLIDLAHTPNDIRDSILEEYAKPPLGSNGKILNYLISKRCNQLIGCAEEFFVTQ
jgi:hypothetical protein